MAVGDGILTTLRAWGYESNVDEGKIRMAVDAYFRVFSPYRPGVSPHEAVGM